MRWRGKNGRMPELPEVEITLRKLMPLIKNKTLVDFWTDWPRGLRLARPDFVKRDIRGRKIIDGHRTGKVIFLHLSRLAGARAKRARKPRTRVSSVRGKPERMLAFHQRMSGRLIFVRRASSTQAGRLEYKGQAYSNVLENIRVRPERWIHFLFKFSDGSELRFTDPRKFGLVWYGSSEDLQKDKYLKTLGVDLQKLTFEEFREKIKQGDQIVKAFLLRQDIIAGVGNIIADESLWQAKIHPKRKTSSLSKKEISSLFAALKKTITEILKAGGTSMRNWGHPDGKKGRYQELYKVYDRAGEKCLRCGKALQRIITAGRGTSFCPKCQSTR